MADMKRLMKMSGPSYRYAALFSLIVSWSYVAGDVLEQNLGFVPLTPRIMIRFALFFTITFMVTLAVWSGIPRDLLRFIPSLKRGSVLRERVSRIHDRFINALVFLLFAVSYLLVQLCEYPGMWTYDAYRVLIRFEERRMNSHIPVFYQVRLGGIVSGIAGITEKDYNLAIFILIFIQVLGAAAVFTFVIAEMRRLAVPAVLRIATFCWLAFSPSVVLHVICSTKDSLFAILLVLSVTLLFSMTEEPEVFFRSRVRQLMLFLSLLVMLLERKNTLYVLILAAPFLLVRVKKRHRLCLLLVTPVVVSLIINASLIRHYNVAPGGRTEALTVPIHQVARTYYFYPEDFSEEEKTFLLSLQPQETWDSYLPKISDSVKKLDADQLFSNPGKAVILWLRQGLKHPATYVESCMLTSFGLWYPNAVMTFEPVDASTQTTQYYAYDVDVPATRRPLFDRVDGVYRAICTKQWVHRIPVLHLFLSPGAMTLFFFFTLITLLQRRRARWCVPLLLPLFTLCTFFLGPCSMTRYVAYLFMLFPLEMCLLWLAGHQKHNTTVV